MVIQVAVRPSGEAVSCCGSIWGRREGAGWGGSPGTGELPVWRLCP
jgi:hypothetical protein